jgi:hypothetical protein
MEVQIPNNKKYAKALEILYQLGGMFRTRPTHVLVVGPAQLHALAKAGLVQPNGTKQSRGKKKKTVRT